MLTVYLMISVGAVLMAAGGVIGTKGWQERSAICRRNDLIRAIAAEMVTNFSVAFDIKYTDPNDVNLRQFTVLPRMQTTALGGAIAAGCFTGKKDRILFTHMSSLIEALNDFNARLAFSEVEMWRNPSDIATWRKKLRDGRTRKGLIQQLREFGELLISDYGIQADERFFVEDDIQSSSQSSDIKHGGACGQPMGSEPA